MTIYEELRDKALAFDATQEDLAALAHWFETEGDGRYCTDDGGFEIDEENTLYPVLVPDVIDEEGEVLQAKEIGWTLSHDIKDRFPKGVC